MTEKQITELYNMANDLRALNRLHKEANESYRVRLGCGNHSEDIYSDMMYAAFIDFIEEQIVRLEKEIENA